MKRCVRAAFVVLDNLMAAGYWLVWRVATVRAALAESAGVPEGRCRRCGCVEEMACQTCEGPCYWVEPDLCSACWDSELDLGGEMRFDPRTDENGLLV